VATSVGNLVHGIATFNQDRLNDNTNMASMQVFINGNASTNNPVNPAAARNLQSLNDLNNWLGRSNYGGDTLLNGTLFEFRIHDQILSLSDARKSTLYGPDVDTTTITGDVPTLRVFTDPSQSGKVQIENNYSVNLAGIDTYRITSAMNALNPTGWTGLDGLEGGDPLGQGWDKVTNPTTGELVEFYLGTTGDTTIGVGGAGVRNLGSAWTVGGAQDLAFTISTPNGATIPGVVVYDPTPSSTTPIPGDYNGDLVVNAADYTKWRNNLGDGNEVDINNAGDGGGVTLSDYTHWKNNYGKTSPGSGASADGGNVPEPTTFVSLVLGGLLVLGSFNRRRAG
jgi:hypothetical protein